MKILDNPMFVRLLLIGVLIGTGRGAAAQEWLVPPSGVPTGTSPMASPSFRAEPAVGSGTRSALPEMELPGAPVHSADPTTSNFLPESISSGDLSESISTGELQPFEASDEYSIFNSQPALLESTGTWLRRGFWYSEVDVLLMDLIWRRDDITLAIQAGTANSLLLEGGRQGVEAIPRLKLGRFLFRDHKNRDHTAEAIFYGGGQWTRSGRLDATDGAVLVGLLSGGNTDFSGATSMQFDYDSRFNNFELNYHVKARMQRDRMELGPSGHWVRRAQPSVSRSFIAGVRHFNLSEDFDWDAFGIDNDADTNTAPQTGNYRVRTDNNLFGTQLGFSWTYETARWSLGLKNKTGIYLSRTDVESSFEVTGGVTSGDNDIRVDNLSFITEAGLIGKWHLKPNFSLRAGLEILYVSSVAHASEQLNFIPVSTSQIVASSDSTFMGALIGFEGYW